MSQQTAPFLEGKYGWNFGESGWNTGMDENILKFSFMFDRNLDSITASLPSAVNGQAHYLTTDNRIYFAVGTTYFSTPAPKWATLVLRSSGDTYQFNGTSLVQVDSPAGLDSRLDALEVTASNLGTAAFEDIAFFATQAALDVVEAESSAYTDALRDDISDDTDQTKGASQVGRATIAVASMPDLLLVSVFPDREQQFNVASYHPGAFALAAPYNGTGGGVFRWDASRAKSEHDGGAVIDPTQVFPSDWDDAGQVSAWFTPAGVGNGCFVRQGGGEISAEMYGARYSQITPIENTASFKQALNYVGPDHVNYPNGRRTVRFGAGKHLITDTLEPKAYQTLQGEGPASIMVFDHALKAIKIGDGITIGGTPQPNVQLRDFCIQKLSNAEPQYPTRIVSVEGNSVNCKLQNVLFDAVFATDSMITNQSGYGLTLEKVEMRYCRADTAHFDLLNLANESNYSYAISMIGCDITGVTKIDGTYWKAIRQAGGQLSIKQTVIQDTGTAIECGNGTQTFPILNLDFVFLEANRDFHINCNGTGNNKPLINMTNCRLNHGLGGNIYLSGAEINITGTQETGTSNWTGDATSHTTRAQVTLGPGNGLILPSDFSVTRGLTMRMAPPTFQDLAGGAGTPFEIYGVNINNSRHSVIQVTHINGADDATTAETFMIRHSAGGGNLTAVSMGRSVGTGGSAGTWTWTGNADGRLFGQFSATGTWRYTVVSTG